MIHILGNQLFGCQCRGDLEKTSQMRTKVLVVPFWIASLLAVWFLAQPQSCAEGGQVGRNEALQVASNRSSEGALVGNPGSGPSSSRSARIQKSPSLSSSERAYQMQARLAGLRDELEKSADPAAVVREILHGVQGVGGLEKIALEGDLENALARIDPADVAKFSRIAAIYPKVAAALKENSYLGKNSEEHLFGLLYTNASIEGVDVYEEIQKIGDPKIRQSFEVGMLPEMMIAKGDAYQEIVDALPEASRNSVYQRAIEKAVKEEFQQPMALELYFQGLGSPGAHPELIDRLFNDPAWFWKDSESVAQIVASAPAGERRDAVLNEMVRLIAKNDPEAARKWQGLVDDQILAEKLKAEVLDKSN